MSIKVDYFAFSIPSSDAFGISQEEVPDAVWQTLLSAQCELLQEIACWEGWEVKKGRGFYNWMLTHTDTGFAFHLGNVNAHIYVECTGKGCSVLDNDGILHKLIEAHHTRASRVDIAVDFETNLDPRDFTNNMQGSRFKVSGWVDSADGKTSYVGSRNSERYARVYRYHPPHPRCEFLRVEHVFHSHYAKAVCVELLSRPLIDVATDAGATFGWSHPIWRGQLAEGSKLPSARFERSGGGLLRWLHKSVAPALLKAHRELDFDVLSWLETSVIPELHAIEDERAQRGARSSGMPFVASR